MAALSTGEPPRSASSEARRRPSWSGSSWYSRRRPSSASMTSEGPARLSSSSPSAQKTNTRSAPRRRRTSAISGASPGSGTPSAYRPAPAGLQRGPSTLKTVRTPSSRLGTAAKRKDGWKRGANRKPIPTSRMQLATPSGARSIRTPSASSTSALPQAEEAARLPCLATRAPQAAATIAETVEMLKLREPSPPVPTTSSSEPGSGTSIGVARARAARARPAISSALSPLTRRAMIRPAIWLGVASPRMISSMACAASSSVSPSPRASLARNSIIASPPVRPPPRPGSCGGDACPPRSGSTRGGTGRHRWGGSDVAAPSPPGRPSRRRPPAREGVGLHDQRMVTGGLEWAGQADERGPPVVMDEGGLPVHRPVADHPGAQGLAQRLVAEADPQDRHLPGEGTDGGHRDPCLGRRPRPRRDDQGVVPGQGRQADLVVAEGARSGAQLGQVLDQVVGEGVVVVDDGHTGGASAHATASACSTAANIARALAMVSSYSRPGSESATTPAPTCT